MLNDFLTTDVNQNTAFCDEILAAIKTATNEAQHFSGNVYDLLITNAGATLSNLHDESVDSESFDLTDLKASLMEWQAKIR
ncbi:MAG: hypothetical protein KAU26_04850 [Methylococcales bacterium]|nr:hypothetical protein [Methylococcales bacterium]